MNNLIHATVISEGATTRCISACASPAPGVRGLAVSGLTDSAAKELCELASITLKSRGFKLPDRRIEIELLFDVPFEAMSELAFAACITLAETMSQPGSSGYRARYLESTSG